MRTHFDVGAIVEVVAVEASQLDCVRPGQRGEVIARHIPGGTHFVRLECGHVEAFRPDQLRLAPPVERVYLNLN